MLKIGIVGSGFGIYGLLPAFSALPNCKVMAVAGKKTERVVAALNHYEVPHHYETWQDLLETENLDALAVAVTPSAQYEIVTAALNKGLHVFAEKPLAVTLTQAKNLMSLAEKKQLTNCLDFTFPELKTWKEVKKIIANKELGEPQQLQLDWSFLSYDIKHQLSSWKTKLDEGGGAVSFYFSHSLYYLEFLCGPIATITSTFTYADSSINDGEVGVDLKFQFESGLNGEAHLSCNDASAYQHQLKIDCSAGVIELSNTQNTYTGFEAKVYDLAGTPRKLDVAEEVGVLGEDERVVVVKKIAQRFVQACLDKKSITPSFKDGVRVQELLQIIRNSEGS